MPPVPRVRPCIQCVCLWVKKKKSLAASAIYTFSNVLMHAYERTQVNLTDFKSVALIVRGPLRWRHWARYHSAIAAIRREVVEKYLSRETAGSVAADGRRCAGEQQRRDSAIVASCYRDSGRRRATRPAAAAARRKRRLRRRCATGARSSDEYDTL